MSSTEQAYADFRDVVNVTPAALEKWLATDESTAAGQRPDRSAAELEHTRWTASLRNWGHDPLQS